MTYNYLLRLWGKKGGGLTIDVSSEPVFLSKKRRINMDVSSGLILLTHKKNLMGNIQTIEYRFSYTHIPHQYRYLSNYLHAIALTQAH